jgi:hypothetical protein
MLCLPSILHANSLISMKYGMNIIPAPSHILYIHEFGNTTIINTSTCGFRTILMPFNIESYNPEV